MSKRDNPRLKEREAEKERAAKAARARYGRKSYGRDGEQSERRSYGAGARDGRRPGRPAGPRDGRPAYDPEKENENTSLIIGRNPVMEAIKAGRTINKIEMQKDGEGSIRKIASMARDAGIQIQYVDKVVLDKLVPGRPHQGIAAFMAAHDYVEVDDILAAAKEKGEDPLVVILDGLEEAGVRILDNEMVVIESGGSSFNLVGIDDVSLGSGRVAEKLDIEKDAYNVVLAHEPQYLDWYSQLGADIVLTGHAHGGQFRFPFIGAVYAPDQGFNPELTEGVYESGRTHMFISRGLGNSVFPFRLFNDPEIVYIDIK